MSPWLTVWKNPIRTIEEYKDTPWVNRQGFISYMIASISLWRDDSPISPLFEEPDVTGIMVTLIGILITAAIFRVIWVGLVFLLGLIWRGQATRRNIDTVVAVSIIPLAILVFYETVCLLLHLQSYAIVDYIFFSITLWIMVFGIAYVQGFNLIKASFTVITPILIAVGLQQISILYTNYFS